MSASIITHIPRWFGWAIPEIEFDPRQQHARTRDVIAWSDLREARFAHVALTHMAREWTLANACDAIAESGVYVPPDVYTLPRLIRGEPPYENALSLTVSPVVAIAPRRETIYCNALRNLSARIGASDGPRCVAEIARDDRRAAYQATVTVVQPMLPRGADEYGELAEQVFEHAITGAPIERSWVAQATAPASELIGAACSVDAIRLLYYLVRATDPLLCADSLASTLEERATIERLVYGAMLERAAEKREKPPA